MLIGLGRLGRNGELILRLWKDASCTQNLGVNRATFKIHLTAIVDYFAGVNLFTITISGENHRGFQSQYNQIYAVDQ